MALPDYLPGRFALVRGRPSDYFALEHFHYLPRRPATYADVWVVTYAEQAHCARALAGGTPSVLRFGGCPPQAAGLNGVALRFGDFDATESLWRSATRRDDALNDLAAPRVVAVGVLSFPSFRSAPRERALILGGLSHRQRTRFCNDHLRTVSRVVVHPQFRGLGLASALVRRLIEACPTRYVEASAVMAHVHPFFAAAGMRQVHDDRRERDDEATPAYFLVDRREEPSCER